MQIDATTGDKYNARELKSGEEMLIDYVASTKMWSVACWMGEQCRWHKEFKGENAEAQALVEFNWYD